MTPGYRRNAVIIAVVGVAAGNDHAIRIAFQRDVQL